MKYGRPFRLRYLLLHSRASSTLSKPSGKARPAGSRFGRLQSRQLECHRQRQLAAGGRARAGRQRQRHARLQEPYRDFEIRAEVWVNDEANSGIFIRCSDPQKVGSANAYEVNIFDQRPDPSYGTGSIVEVAKVSPMPKAGGRWNTLEIVAKGSKFSVVFNGTRTVENAEDSKFASGPIALQYGKGIVKFRKVQIKPI